MYRDTDRFQNWFITSLQTDVNDTTASFRLNKALMVHKARLVIDPYDESNREIIEVTSVDGTLIYVNRGADNTLAHYHQEGALVVMDVVAADLNNLYYDWAEAKADFQKQQDDFQVEVAAQISNTEKLAFLAAHPVGSTYWNETVSTNPGAIYGGTWVALQGVVLGGRSTVGGSPFNVAAGTIIGADTHTLNVDQMPSHTHYSVDRMLVWDAGKTSFGSVANGWQVQSTGWGGFVVGNTGGGGAHNNIQRTLVGYLWKRTA